MFIKKILQEYRRKDDVSHDWQQNLQATASGMNVSSYKNTLKGLVNILFIFTYF